MNFYLLTQEQRDLIATDILQPILVVYSTNIEERRFAITENLIDPNILLYENIIDIDQLNEKIAISKNLIAEIFQENKILEENVDLPK